MVPYHLACQHLGYIDLPTVARSAAISRLVYALDSCGSGICDADDGSLVVLPEAFAQVRLLRVSAPSLPSPAGVDGFEVLADDATEWLLLVGPAAVGWIAALDSFSYLLRRLAAVVRRSVATANV